MRKIFLLLLSVCLVFVIAFAIERGVNHVEVIDYTTTQGELPRVETFENLLLRFEEDDASGGNGRFEAWSAHLEYLFSDAKNILFGCGDSTKYLDSNLEKYPFKAEGRAFGIIVHQFIADYVSRLYKGSVPYERMDRRIFRVIWEHKKAMLCARGSSLRHPALCRGNIAFLHHKQPYWKHPPKPHRITRILDWFRTEHA